MSKPLEFMSANDFLKHHVCITDMVEFERKGYMHWALYAGNGQVINIDAKEKVTEMTAKISRRTLLEVAGKDRCRVNNKSRLGNMCCVCHDRRSHEILEEVSSKIVGTEVPYNFTGKNCEYYCTLWRSGQRISHQVISSDSFL